MKISRYNHLFTREDKYFVYNSLTNSFAQIGKEIYTLLKKNEISQNFDDDQEVFDEETLKILKDMKVVDVNDDVECSSIKFKALSQRFNVNDLSLTINPTLSCNFCCPYCFEVNHDSIYMSDEVEDEIIGYIKRFVTIKIYMFVYPGFVIDISGKDCNCSLFNNFDMSEFINRLYSKHGIYLPMIYPDGNISSCSVRHPYSTIIGPKGELYKCWNDVGNKNKVYGSLSDGIINKEIFLKYVMDADNLTDPICEDCKFIPICNGGCPYVRIQEKDKGRGCEKACVLFRNNPDEFLWNHYNFKKILS